MKRTKNKNVRRKAKPANSMPRNAARGSKVKRGAQPQRFMLDGAANAYAQLLRDPCNGPLVGFYGGSGGYVQRFSSVFTVGNTAATTAGILCINPGAGTVGWADVASDTTVATVSYSNANFPGATFITNTAKGFRVLACCAKAYTNASETNRAGYIGCGIVPMTEAPAQATAYTSPSALQALLPWTTRTPGDMTEVRWKPGTDDQEYNHNSPGSQIDASIGGQNAILCAWTGQPAATGFRVIVTAVIEWVPNVSNGFVTDAMRPPASRNTVDEVVRALSISDPTWWHNAATVAVRVAKSAALGYSTGGAIGGLIGGIRAVTL